MILETLVGLAVYSNACLKEHELAHAGGWGSAHPGGVHRRECGALPMPPRHFPLRKSQKIVWHYGWIPCFQAVACTYPIGGETVHIFMPPEYRPK